jgi:CBS domain-containing protein
MDLMRVSFEDSFGVSEKQAVYEVLDHTLNVEAVMTKNPVTILLNHSIKEAAEILSSHSFHSLPVVDDNHELQGIVTSADLIKYLLALY